MRNTDEIIFNGIKSTNMLGGLSLLQSYMNVDELLASLPKEHLLLEQFSTNYSRSINKENLNKLENYYRKCLIDNTPFDAPQVSLVVYGNTQQKNICNRFISLQSTRNDSVIIDGFLIISALSYLLDKVDPFTGKKSDKSTLSIKQKQKLNSIDVRLSIYYKQNEKIDDESISKLFFDINTLDTKIYSQHITTHFQESPLNLGAEKLALALNLNELGGVAEINKITKSDSFITTKNTLIHILLASLSGKNARVEKQLPTYLPDKTLITDQVIDNVLKVVIPFMKGWISSLEIKFKRNSNGFHRSMQIWQALGIVVYNLTQINHLTKQELFTAGQILGQLDYDKSASHWGNCKALKKDISNSFWINATGGGRTFRDKVAEYFIEIL